MNSVFLRNVLSWALIFFFLPLREGVCEEPFSKADVTDSLELGHVLDQAPPIPPESTHADRQIFFEGVLTLHDKREGLFVPLSPLASFPPVTGRFDVDWKEKIKLGEGGRFVISDRLTLQHNGDVPFDQGYTLRNDWREGYFSHTTNGFSLDIGRVNVRSGVASGYNPTDYLRGRSVVEYVSRDPSILRENRLGTFMIRSEKVFAKGALSVLFAPRLAPVSRVDLQGDSGFNPQFGRTNAENRLVLRGNYAIFPDFDPEVSLLVSPQKTGTGLNLTHSLTDRVTGYVEWSGGVEKSLLQRAYEAGLKEGVFPENSPPPLPFSGGERFYHDLALGVSVTATENIDLAFEYDYHGAGFSQKDWDLWFQTGRQAASSGGWQKVRQLYYLRQYALDQLEPLGQHHFFARVAWRNFLIHDLTLSALTIANPIDGSVLQQVDLRWDVSRKVSLSATLGFTLGGKKSEQASSSEAQSLLLNLTYYL